MLYVIDSLQPGGAEMSLAGMSGCLRDRGVLLDVAYFKEVPGVHAELIAGGATLFHVVGRGRLGRAVAVRRLVRQRRPDLVHTTLFEADVAGRIGAVLAHTPVVSSLVNTPYGPEHRAGVSSAWRLRAAHAVDAVTSRSVRRFHANSFDTATVMSRRLAVRRSKIDVVHRGRSASGLGRRDAIRRAKVRGSLGIDDSTPLVLAVARHDHAKGLDLLLRTVPKLRAAHPDLVVLIAGRAGNHTPVLEQLAARMAAADSTAVRFMGHRNDVADLLAAADVLAFPSRKEGLPGTLIEALAMECPVVASDLPAIREVVGGAGQAPSALLVPPDDVDALGDGIASVLADAEVRSRLVATARHRFESQFTLERSAAGILAFYLRALKRTEETG